MKLMVKTSHHHLADDPIFTLLCFFFQVSLYRASRMETAVSTVVHPAESEPKCPESPPRSPHSQHPEEVALSVSETFTKSPSSSPK